MKDKFQAGFGVIELLMVIVVVAAIGLGGWKVYDSHHKGATSNAIPLNGGSPTASNVSTAPAVNSTSDLDKALQTLNQNDPTSANSSDSSQLNSQTAAF